jgi:hypothetical protein
MNQFEYYSSLLKLLDEVKWKKIERFGNLYAKGKELCYNPFLDVLYADLNYTLTNGHVGIATLKFLKREIAEKAEEILNEKIPKKDRIIKIAKLVKGIKVSQLKKASERASEEVNIAEYILEDLKNLKPTSLVIFTNVPSITAEIFVEMKIKPICNSSIRVYASEFEQKHGILTGKVKYVPDEFERYKIIAVDHFKFLKKHLELIS